MVDNILNLNVDSEFKVREDDNKLTDHTKDGEQEVSGHLKEAK